MPDTTIPSNPPNNSPAPTTSNPSGNKIINTFKTVWRDKKKRWWLIGGGTILLILIVWGIVAAVNKPPEKITIATPTPEIIATATPEVQYSMLDGTLVGPERATRHPLGIMVENLSSIRPQTGLSDASIVYESIVEGGITRYMALYAPNLPARVGPVRSARTQFLDWAQEYTPESAHYAHVGGSADALSKIVGDTINDLDQFSVGAKAFQRFPKAGLASEHTMYTFPDRLYEAAKNKKYKTESTFKVWQFKEEADIANRPESQSITVPYSSAVYTVKFTYDKASNTYKRKNGSKDDIDAANNKQIAVKNLIVHFASYQDTGKKGIQRVGLIGDGTAKIFLDGKVIEAKWHKSKPKERTIYTDTATGAEVQFNRGQFWIAAPKSGTAITVQ